MLASTQGLCRVSNMNVREGESWGGTLGGCVEKHQLCSLSWASSFNPLHLSVLEWNMETVHCT